MKKIIGTILKEIELFDNGKLKSVENELRTEDGIVIFQGKFDMADYILDNFNKGDYVSIKGNTQRSSFHDANIMIVKEIQISNSEIEVETEKEEQRIKDERWNRLTKEEQDFVCKFDALAYEGLSMFFKELKKGNNSIEYDRIADKFME